MLEHEWKDALARRVRAARGLESQATFARRAGLSVRLIGTIEGRQLRAWPRESTLVRMALAAGEDPEVWLRSVGRPFSTDTVRSIVEVARGRVRPPYAALERQLATERDQANELRRCVIVLTDLLLRKVEIVDERKKES